MRVVSADWVVPVEGEPIADGAVAIDDDGRIAAVGPSSELGVGERFEHAVICPGFVNAHSHLEYQGYGGFGDGLPFPQWIAVHIERKGRLDEEGMLAQAFAGAGDCLRSGITTVADASFSGAAVEAAAGLGLRAIVCLEVFDFLGPDAVTASFEPMRERVAGSLSDRVRLGISPHAPYTVSAPLYQAAYATGLPVVTHLSESLPELEFLTTGSGPWAEIRHLLVEPPGETGTRLLARLGLLGSRTIAAHCVHVDEEEIELLARHDAAVAHCPRSNSMLGCGVAPLLELRAAGVRVGLGTDSPASTPSFDMFEEMRTALFAARARAHTPAAISAADILRLATLDGARALGLADLTGSLVAGKAADLAVVSLDGSSFDPAGDPVAAAVFAGSPDRVIATLVGGDDRYRRESTRWHDLRNRARAARRAMLA
ncbi:MAG: amidohydrolase family protein [Gaiella sp.]